MTVDASQPDQAAPRSKGRYAEPDLAEPAQGSSKTAFTSLPVIDASSLLSPDASEVDKEACKPPDPRSPALGLSQTCLCRVPGKPGRRQRVSCTEPAWSAASCECFPASAAWCLWTMALTEAMRSYLTKHQIPDDVLQAARAWFARPVRMWLALLSADRITAC